MNMKLEQLLALDDATLGDIVTQSATETGISVADAMVQPIIRGFRKGVFQWLQRANSDDAMRSRLNGEMQRFYAGYGLRSPTMF